MTAYIDGITNPECSPNNTSLSCNAITSSFDPNAKSVAAQNGSGYTDYDEIDDNDELTYRIQFQNTGNDTASTVIIRDTLPAELDPETVFPGASSHSYNWARNGHALIFQFDNIDLVDSLTNEPLSHGFIKYRVSQIPGNAPGTDILNNAAIYFDQNPPIFTNTVTNHLPMPIAVDPGQNLNVEVYPNPGHDRVTVVVPEQAEVEVYDILGNLVLRTSVDQGKNELNTQALKAGVYLYRISSGGAMLRSGKWMKF